MDISNGAGLILLYIFSKLVVKYLFSKALKPLPFVLLMKLLPAGVVNCRKVSLGHQVSAKVFQLFLLILFCLTIDSYIPG